MSEEIFKKNQESFLTLVRAGLWEECESVSGERLAVSDSDVLRLAEEQSLVGLVTAGVEKLPTGTVPLTEKLTLLGKCQLIEQRNEALNSFIGELLRKLQEANIKSLLVKGQGVAQCYSKPNWRASGDVDLLLDGDNYEEAKTLLLPLASSQKLEERYSRHLGLSIGSWYIELHGSLRTGLSSRIDKEVDAVQKDTFANGRFRVWHNGVTDVLLPAPNDDVFFVFTHFIKHFYKEGMNLRQVCDWCRLLWTYRKEIDVTLLEHHLRKVGLMSEWKAFAALAVNSLGMPVEAMPLYDSYERWKNKGEKILEFILKGDKHGKVKDTQAIAKVFPRNTLCSAPSIFLNVNGLKIKELVFLNY